MKTHLKNYFLIIIALCLLSRLDGLESQHDVLSLPYAISIQKHPGGKEGIAQDEIESHITISKLLTEAGCLYAKIGENEKAIEKYEEALAHYATGELYSHYGDVLFQVDSFARAIQAYKIAGSLGREIDADTYYKIACAYSRMENASIAFEYLEIAIMNGFRDFEKIRDSYDLKFLYTQPGWQNWLNNKEKFLQHSENKLQPDLVAEYLFNGNVNDNSVNQNHGLIRGASLTIDRFKNPNSAYYFDGTDDCIKVIDPKGLPSGDKPKSITAWFQFDCEWANQPGKCANIGGFGAPDTGANFQVGIRYGEEFVVWGWTGPKDWSTGISARSYMDHQWHFIAVVYDGSTTTLYLDTDKPASTPAYRWNTKPKKIVIGNEIDEQGHEFKGSIDNFCIYDRALKEEEVKLLYHEGNYIVK